MINQKEEEIHNSEIAQLEQMMKESEPIKERFEFSISLMIGLALILVGFFELFFYMTFSWLNILLIVTGFAMVIYSQRRKQEEYAPAAQMIKMSPVQIAPPSNPEEPDFSKLTPPNM